MKAKRRPATPICPRCGSDETEQIRNFGAVVKGRFVCLSCKRWFGPHNPPNAGGTGEDASRAR